MNALVAYLAKETAEEGAPLSEDNETTEEERGDSTPPEDDEIPF